MKRMNIKLKVLYCQIILPMKRYCKRNTFLVAHLKENFKILATDYSSSLPTYWQSDNQQVDNYAANDQHDWLRELADIATGPHSPLLQNKPDNLQE